MSTVSVADVLNLITRDPGRPRLTWYGSCGERVELSGAVLENWVNKTVNLFVDELDLEPGMRVLVDLPPHWRTVVWALAVWRTGACVELGAEDDRASDADLVVTDRPSHHATSAPVVAVSLPALARSFVGELPAGAIDAATAVMSQADVLGWAPALVPTADALRAEGVRRTHQDLFADAATQPQPRARTLHTTREGRSGAVVDLLEDIRSSLAADGSVVCVSPGFARELDADEVRRERFLASERITSP